MGVITVAGRPSNLVLPEGTAVTEVESDLYNICDRVKGISPRLSIILADSGEKYAFIVMEHCADGVERLVFKVRELDGRVVKRLEQLMAMPLAARYEELEKQAYRLEQEEHENQMEELYERLGRPMWTQLEHDGFIQRGVSYPKTGVAKPGKVR